MTAFAGAENSNVQRDPLQPTDITCLTGEGRGMAFALDPSHARSAPQVLMHWTPNKVTLLRVIVGFAAVSLFGRGAWAHDFWSAPNITAGFQALPGSIFVVTGAAPATDLALASAGMEIGFRNGFSLGARFDGEFAENSRKYSGLGWLRYTF